MQEKHSEAVLGFRKKKRFLTADATGKTIFMLGSTGMKKLEADKFTPITYTAELTIDHASEREYMYNYMAREAKQRCSREDMNEE